MTDSEQVNVRVMVRCRPFNSREIELSGGVENLKSVVLVEGSTVRVLDPEKNYQEREAFDFDEAFWSIPDSQGQFSTNKFAGQLEVFEKTGAVAVANAMRGYHNTIFAYGQTGSGKTHSMLGHGADEGIAPRLVRALFAAIEQDKITNTIDRTQYTVELSFLEIYNEKVKDLLAVAQAGQGRSNHQKSGSSAYAECRVRFHPEKGTFVEGLTHMVINTEQECLTAITGGMEHRAVTSTLMNDTSSRSHAIFQICLSQKSPLKGTSRVSIVNLVDLAGSERIKMSGVSGQALQEAKNINLSLSTLRRVIDVMIDNSQLKPGQRPGVPPYRESLLTWVLSDSLGGNSKTAMVAAISPFAGNIEDTIGTLRYALKAKAIVCNARVNEEKTAAVVSALRHEMEELRRQLEAKAELDHQEQDRLTDALAQRETEFLKMQDESRRLDEAKKEYERELERKADELQKAQEQMALLENVEERKVQKEEELLRARELQAQTAILLKQQEDERRKKDTELAEVIQRRDSLKRHHDLAAQEEAKARLAAEQARRRQFVGAFQNAFIIGKQRSGLEELREECVALEARVEALEQDVRDRDCELNNLVSEKSLLQRKVEMLEKKCQSMQHDLTEVMQSKNDKITDLTAQKAAADEELAKAQGELARRQDELARLQKLFAEEQERTAVELVTLQATHDEVAAAIAVKEQRLAQLQTLLADSRTRLASVSEAAVSSSERIAVLREETRVKEQRVEQLRAKKAELEARRNAASAILEDRRERLAAVQEHLDRVAVEAASLRQNHNDLRQYVSQKFFPVATPNRRTHANPNSPSLGGQLSPAGGLKSPPQAGSATRARSPSGGAVHSASYHGPRFQQQHQAGSPPGVAAAAVQSSANRSVSPHQKLGASAEKKLPGGYMAPPPVRSPGRRV